jgi:hypothetical protein
MPVIVPSGSPRTLGDMKTRIADELARADLTPQIALAISDAMLEASTHRFWFLETRGMTIPLSAGTDTYTSADIEALTEIDRLALITSGQRRTLRLMSDDELDRSNDGTVPTGEPYAYSRYGNQLRLYPTPNQDYTISIDGLTNGGALDNDLASNVWTNQGERYVRTLAKRNVMAEVIRDFDEAQKLDGLAVRFRDEMNSQTHDRVATGQMAYNG